MQCESCALRSIQVYDGVGAVSPISRIQRLARLSSAGVFPINVAETANASLDMTAAVVDAAPFSAGRRTEGRRGRLVVPGVSLFSPCSSAPACCA